MIWWCTEAGRVGVTVDPHLLLRHKIDMTAGCFMGKESPKTFSYVEFLHLKDHLGHYKCSSGIWGAD